MRLRRLATNLLIASLYTLVYIRCYVSFLNFHFEYVGYDLYSRPFLFLVTSFVIAIAPVLCYRGVRAVSSAISVLVYLVLYVPIIITFALGSSRPLPEIGVIQLTFLTGMSLLFLSDTIIIRSPVRLELSTLRCFRLDVRSRASCPR